MFANSNVVVIVRVYVYVWTALKQCLCRAWFHYLANVIVYAIVWIHNTHNKAKNTVASRALICVVCILCCFWCLWTPNLMNVSSVERIRVQLYQYTLIIRIASNNTNEHKYAYIKWLILLTFHFRYLKKLQICLLSSKQ